VAGPRSDEEAARSWERDGAAARRFRPLLSLPHFAGVAPWYYEWMRHPPCDPWWNFARLEGRYARVDAAVLNLSGWFDEMYGPIGAVENFLGAGDALVLGPWTHGVGAVQRERAGDRSFGAAAALDYTATVLGWMDRHLKDGAAPVGDKPVRVFVMGANEWREADRWPIPGARADTLYLEAAGGSHRPGRLVGHPPAGRGETILRSDPARPVEDPFGGSFGAHDYRALRPAPGIAVFETAPFAAPLEIVGRVVVELTAAATVPDFDLWVQLFDVAPDGTAWNLSSPGTTLQRASYRGGGPERRLLRPGESVQLRLDRLVTANRFLPGHRLRIVLTPQFAPLFSINPQTGLQEFGSDSVRAGEIRIGGVSRVVLPVMTAED
jgi:putative CocE/NonD family hydrolase